jgi:predicted RNA-binding protein YlqC (UPF0109 family)
MGKVCKRLGRSTMALRHFVTALDLDPKDSNLVKVLEAEDREGMRVWES